MSSSFVKDCSDASSAGNSNPSKTVIIIVNNETGNVALDGNELQNLLATHGADTSQVSVVQMGSGGNALPTVAAPVFASGFGGVAGPSGLPVNFMVDGFSAIPIEGSAVGGYADLPLDADALQRLESVLGTEEAKQILGEPLLDIVNDPNQLADQLEKLMPNNADNGKEGVPIRKKRAPPKRRSQRQMDKAEREEVEKILAENQLMLRKEREELLQQQQQQQQQQEEQQQEDDAHSDDDVDDDNNAAPEKEREESETENKGKAKSEEAKGRGKGKKITSPSASAGGKGRGGKGRGAPVRVGVGARARGGKSIKGGKKMPGKEEETEEDDKDEKKKGKKKKPASPTKQGGAKTLPKALQMKELSVKVKKLNERLLHEQPQDEGGKRSSIFSQKDIPPEETLKEGGDATGVESEVPAGGHSKGHGRAPSPQLSPTPDKTTPQAPIAKTAIKKGSKTARKTSVQNGLSDSSLSKVQNIASQSALNKLEVNSTKEPELELNSEIPDTLRPCGDTTTTTLSDEKSDIVNFDSKSTCQILIPTQNFSDKEETLNSQKDLTQVKITSKQTTPDTQFSQNLKQPQIESAVRETKLKNKTTKVLNPKEKSEVFVLNSVILKNQKDNLFEASENTDAVTPKKTPTRQSPTKTVPKVIKTQLCKDKLVSGGKSGKLVSWKENERENAPPKVHHQSPSISKSLMNYKIPLKNAGQKRPLLNHQIPGRPPLPTQSNLQRISIPLLPTPTLTHSSKKDSQITSPTLTPTTKTIPPPANTPHVNSPRPKPTPLADKTVSQFSNANKKTHIKGSLSNHPISSHKEPTSHSNSTPQKNNTVTKKHPPIVKSKTVKGTSVINVKTENKGNTNTLNKTLSNSLHGNKLKGVSKKTPFKTLPKDKLKKGPKMSVGGTQIRRSGRPIKKKSFGDDILFLDEKTPIVSDDEKPDSSDSDEAAAASEDESSHNAESASDDDDDNASDEEDMEDDPQRLWCICQKPHNNRFMICCDRCEDWFHGSCVGITKPMGKQMEEQEREWICPNCRKAERAIKGLSTPVKKEVEKINKLKLKMSPEVKITKIVENQKTEKASKLAKKIQEKAKVKERTEPRVLVYEKATGIVLSGTAAPTLNILADWLKAHPAYTPLQPAMINSLKNDPKTGVKKINLEEFGLKPEKPNKVDRNLTFQQKIDSGTHSSGAKKGENKNRTTKLLKHSEVMQMEVNRKTAEAVAKQTKQAKPEPVPEPSPKKKKSSSSVFNYERKASIDKVESVKKGEKNELARKNSIDKPELHKSNSIDENSSSSNSSVTKKSHFKDFIKDPALKKITPLKSPDVIDKVVPKSDVMNVRNSVRKMLFDALDKRKSEVKNEFVDMTPQEIKSLCQEIEEQLYACFNKDVGFKYKSRYRSLMFNIRDTKNSGLYRKILNRTIPPERLAYMTSEELASKELAEWREREEKKELEAIQKHELERLALGDQYIMKSHKGEIVIDKEEFPSKSKDTESVISMAPDPSKALPDPDPQDDPDMTNHRNHIYDPACKICTAASELQESGSAQEEMVQKSGSREKEKSHSDDSDKEKRRRRRSSGDGRRESESSSSHHSKHKKREKERRHSHKNRNRDRSRDRSRERERNRSRERDREKDKERDRSREKDRERDRSREKDRERDRSREKDRERDRSKERYRDKSRRSSKDRERRNSKEYHRHERRSSKEERRKEERKRRHSDSRKEDRKRRESENSHRKRDDVTEHKKESRSENLENGDGSINLLQAKSFVAMEMKPTEKNEEAREATRSPTEGLELPLTPLPLPDVTSPTIIWEGGTPPLPENVPDSPSYSPPDRSPSTPPLPTEIDEDFLLSPATPPLPDEEDRLTPPPHSSLPSQRQADKSHQMPIWKGIISMPDVAKFSAAAFEVSGKALFFTGDVPSVIEVVGRINPDTVWSYIAQMKKSGSKEILVVRFQPACEEEKVSYIALYSYLSSKKRYGVIGNCEKSVKDFYVVPLASHQPIPQALLPLDGPGFEESRPHMLIGVIIRMKHRRIYDPRTGSWTTIGEPPHQYNTQEVQVDRDSTLEEENERSYTPPPTLASKDKKKKSPIDDEDEDEIEAFTPSPQSTDGVTLPPASEERGSKADRESMLAELNRQIERDRKELSEMQRKMDEKMEKKKVGDSPSSGAEADEEDNKGSSPSRNEEDGGESASFNSTAALDTSKINIPSNLHEILDSIKKKEEAIREKENEIKRRLNLQQEEQEIATSQTTCHQTSSSKDVDLRLILGSGQDQDLRLLTRPRGPGVPPGVPVVPVVPGASPGPDPRVPVPPHMDQDFRSRDPRIPRDVLNPQNEMGNGPTLSAMTDEDLVAKAQEMERPPADVVKPPFPRGPEQHPAPHMMMGPPGGPPIMPPLQEGAIPPPNPYGNPALPPMGFRHPGPYNINPVAPNVAPPMRPPPMPHASPYRPSQPHGPPFGLPRAPLERLPMQGPPDEYHAYQRSPVIDERRPRIEDGGPHPHRSVGSWESRGERRSWDAGDEMWDHRGWDQNSSDRYPDDGRGRKRRWKDGGGPPPPPRSRWGGVDEDWRGGREGRNWRKEGKRPRKDRPWSRGDGPPHDAPPPQEIDY